MRLATSNWLDAPCIQSSLRMVLALKLRVLRLLVASSEILNSKAFVFQSRQSVRVFLISSREEIIFEYERLQFVH
jgi:hypothetical protein